MPKTKKTPKESKLPTGQAKKIKKGVAKVEKKEVKKKEKKIERPKKKAIKKEIEKKEVKKKETKPEIKKVEEEKYYKAIGRRKTAVAEARLFTRGEKVFLVNDKPLNVYFPNPQLQQIALASLNKMKAQNRFLVLAKVKGGGFNAQAQALRHAIARALILFNPDYRKRLKRAGFLTRDPRMKERKKFGLKRARRAPQWQKR